MSKDSITVHTLSPVVEGQVQPSETDFDVAKEDATLLSRGWAVARAGCETIGWHTPNARELQDCGHRSPVFSVLDSLNLGSGLFKNAYTYLPAPPLVPTAAALMSSIAKEWGTRSSESETFCTADLNPFESALFHLRSYSPVGGDATVPRGGRDRRWSLGSSSPSRPPTKRARVEVDTGPLDELIPLVLDDPSRAVLHMLTKVHQSPIMFLHPSTRRIPAHCRVPRRLTATLLLSCRFRHRPRLPSRLYSRPCMPVLPG